MTTTEYASHTSPIDPRDFTDWKAACHRGWTPGLLALIVDALEGTRVGIVVDNMTGHMPMNVRLVGMGSSPSYGNPTVIVEHAHEVNCTQPRTLPDGRTRQPCPPNCRGFHRTAYLWFKIGLIVPLEREWFKSELMKRLYDMSGKTLTLAQEALGGKRWYGTWTHTIESPTSVHWECIDKNPNAVAPPDWTKPPRTRNYVTVEMPAEVTP